MAGVQWSSGSMTRREMHGTLMHNSKDTRLEHQHTNEDIDPTKTPDNWSVLGRTYDEKVAFVNARLSQVDCGRQSSGKNERIVAHDLIIYCPPEVEARGMGAVHEFFQGAYEALCTLVGAENVIDFDVHVDERHDYVDPDTGEVVRSRIHGHLSFVPVVTEKDVRVREKVQAKDDDGNLLFETVTDDDGTTHDEPVWERDRKGRIKRRGGKVQHVRLDTPELNDSAVATRDNITRSNQLMDEMCKEHFGCTYTTGKAKKRRGKTVEQLKIDSAQAADDMARKAEERLSDAVSRILAAQQRLADVDNEASEAAADLELTRQQQRDAARSASQAQEEAETARREAEAARAAKAEAERQAIATRASANSYATEARRKADEDAEATTTRADERAAEIVSDAQRKSLEVARDALASVSEAKARVEERERAADTREQEACTARDAYKAAETAYKDATPTVAGISPGAFLKRCFAKLTELARPRSNPFANMVNLGDEPREDDPATFGDQQAFNALAFVQRFFAKIGKTIEEFGDEVATDMAREQGRTQVPDRQAVARARQAEKEFYARLVGSKNEMGGVSHSNGGRQMGE